MKNDLPKGVTINKRRFSPVWLTPILALAITGWLLFNGYINTGKEIRVQFDSGAGIIAGKTPLQYRGINVGVVTDFEIADSLDRVNVVIRLAKEADDLAREGMIFWVVKPRLSIDRISGLETIISGSYIEVQPPSYDEEAVLKLPEQDFFIGYSEPPSYQFEEGTTFIELFSAEDPGLTNGMSVYYKGMDVGKIISVRYDEDIREYRIQAAVSSNYKKYINSSTRFWNISGLDVKLDSGGFHLKSNPVASLFQGGIAFDSEYEDAAESPKKEYELYSEHAETLLCDWTVRLHMPESYGVKKSRTPVMYRGLPVGLVTGLRLAEDGSGVTAEFRLNRGYEHLAREGTKFLLEKPEVSIGGVKNLATAVTGVYLNMIPGDGAPADEFVLYEGPVNEMPADSVRVTFRAGDKGAVNIGSGLYYRGIRVGSVTDVRLDGQDVIFEAAVYSSYKDILADGLYLWRSELLNISLDEKGVSVRTAGLSRVIDGGVTMGFFGKRVGSFSGEILSLYGSEASAKEAYISSRGIKKIYLKAEDASGISKGAPVVYRGVRVGELGNRFLDRDTGDIRISALIDPEYSYLLNSRTYFWKLGGALVKFDGDELKVDAPGLKEIITGGVGFENDAPGDAAEISERVYDNRAAAQKAVKEISAGKKIRIFSDGISFPSEGAHVYFKGAEAGEILETGYDTEDKKSYADIIIYRDFTDTLSDTTRFWKSGTIQITPTGEGVQLRSESAASYISGALHYDSFGRPGGMDVLYADRVSAEAPDHVKAEVFLDAPDGLKIMAPVLYRGVKVGFVSGLRESEEGSAADVLVYERYRDYLREGAVFWLEGVSLSLDGVENPESAVFGPKLMMIPGQGAEKFSFEASAEPVSPYIGMEGLRLVLYAENGGSLVSGSPVLFRKMRTGGVERVRLAEDGSRVEIDIFIEESYRHLVNSESLFHQVSGVEMSFGLFRGLRMKTGSVRTVLEGGIEFTDGEDKGDTVSDGSVFDLVQD